MVRPGSWVDRNAPIVESRKGGPPDGQGEKGSGKQGSEWENRGQSAPYLVLRF